MKLYLFLVAFFLLVIGGISPIAAQNQPMIEWSMDSACGERSYVPVTDMVECDGFVVNGHNIRVMHHNGVFLGVSFVDDGDYLVADVYILNNTTDRLLVDPATWVSFHYKDRNASAADKKKVDAALAIPPEQIAKKVQANFAWRSALSGALTGLATTSSTSAITGRVTTSTGQTATYSGNSTTTGPDIAARERNARTLRDQQAVAADKATTVLSSGLRSNTLLPNRSVSGLVYFKRPKKAIKFSHILIKHEKAAFFIPIEWK